MEVMEPAGLLDLRARLFVGSVVLIRAGSRFPDRTFDRVSALPRGRVKHCQRAPAVRVNCQAQATATGPRDNYLKPPLAFQPTASTASSTNLGLKR
jgi:hypothetical protein